MDQAIKLRNATISTSTPTTQKTKRFFKDLSAEEEISHIHSQIVKKKPIINLVIEAIKVVGSPKKGASYQAIKKFVLANQEMQLSALKVAILKGLDKGQLVRPGKPTAKGLVGYFCLPKEDKGISKSQKKDKTEPSVTAAKNVTSEIVKKPSEESPSESEKKAPKNTAKKSNKTTNTSSVKVAKKLNTKTNKYQITAAKKADSKIAKKSPKKVKKLSIKAPVKSIENEENEEISPKSNSKVATILPKKAVKKVPHKTVSDPVGDDKKISPKEMHSKAAKKSPKKAAKKFPSKIVEKSPEGDEEKSNKIKIGRGMKKNNGNSDLEHAEDISSQSQTGNEESKEKNAIDSNPKKAAKKLPNKIVDKSPERDEEKSKKIQKGRDMKKNKGNSDLERAEDISNQSQTGDEESKELNLKDSKTGNSSAFTRKNTEKPKPKVAASKNFKTEAKETLQKAQEKGQIGKELGKQNKAKETLKVKDSIDDQSNDNTKRNKTLRNKKLTTSKDSDRKDVSDTEIDIKKNLSKTFKNCVSDSELEISKRKETKTKKGSKMKKDGSKVLLKKTVQG